MAVRADPLDIPGSESYDDGIARYKVIGDDTDEPIIFLDTREDGYAAKWGTDSDITAFREQVEEVYAEPEALRVNAMFHSEQAGPGTEITTSYDALLEQAGAWDECSSLKIEYGPHDVLWMEQEPNSYRIVYSSDVADTDPLETYFQTTASLDADVATPVLEAVRSQIEQDLNNSSDSE